MGPKWQENGQWTGMRKMILAHARQLFQVIGWLTTREALITAVSRSTAQKKVGVYLKQCFYRSISETIFFSYGRTTTPQVTTHLVDWCPIYVILEFANAPLGGPRAKLDRGKLNFGCLKYREDLVITFDVRFWILKHKSSEYLLITLLPLLVKNTLPLQVYLCRSKLKQRDNTYPYKF